MPTDTFSNIVKDILKANPEYAKPENSDLINRNLDNTAYDEPAIISKQSVVPEDYRIGAPALMNEHAIITVGNKGDSYKDEQFNLWLNEDIAPTARNLIEKWNELNPFAPYKIEDFLYAKHYGKIPNSHLITLRRFYRPTFDNMQVHINDGDPDFLSGNRRDIKKIHYPISTAVTWFGNETENELNSLLGFSCGFNWESLKSDVHQVNNGSVNYEGGGQGGMLKNLFRTVALATGDPHVQSGGSGFGVGTNFDPYTDGAPYANRVYGPINVIMETMKRERGLNFNQEFELTFSYTLRSIDSNNPKVVMLDIMSNFLSLAFNFAEFWGGVYRFQPGSWKNSPIPGGIGFISQLHTGDVDTIFSATQNMMSQMKGGINTMWNKMKSASSGGIKGIMNEVMGMMQGTGAMKSILESFGMGNLNEVMAIPPLLTGDPIGEWHMTVGNPFNPTMMVGNLIIEDMTVGFSNELGIEGFPTEMNFKIKLKHGRPRDSADIQSMFNRGNGRIYNYMDESINQSSSTVNTRNDNGDELARKFGFETHNGNKLRR